jgi:EamA domain-containing membrane protein RarD
VLVYQYLITLTGVTLGIVFFGEKLRVDKIVAAPSSSSACISPGAGEAGAKEAVEARV